MSSSARGATVPPWQYSAALGGHYVFNPRTDEIIMSNGRRFPRPHQMPLSSLANARYDGQLPQARSASAPDSNPPFGTRHQQARTTSENKQNSPDVRGGVHGLNNAADRAKGNPRSRADPTQNNSPATAANPRDRESFSRSEPGPNNTRLDQKTQQRFTDSFPDYRVRDKKFFVVGRVFHALWAEPGGGNAQTTSGQSGIVINNLGQPMFSKARIFIVIREGSNYCNALPINTYGGQGVAKRMVNKAEHAIIYTGGVTPPLPHRREMPARGEQGMQPVAIRVDPDDRSNRLDLMSRVDFGGVTRIQHNIKVKPFGLVNSNSLRDLLQQFNAVFMKPQIAKPTPSAPGRGTLYEDSLGTSYEDSLASQEGSDDDDAEVEDDVVEDDEGEEDDDDDEDEEEDEYWAN